MKLSEWNSLLFEKLVVENGHPGDPLYLYVDDDMLADLSGMSNSQKALQDFTLAFESDNFESAARQASKWKQSGFEGVPSFMAALAMTVLAVTLEPLGKNSNNVYARQWDLLGA